MCKADSEISEAEDDDDLDESLLDRVYALKDIIPPTYRTKASDIASTGYSWVTSAASFSGKSLWVISTSALLLGVPWALAFTEEQQVQEMEREMRMQQSANEVGSQHASTDDKILTPPSSYLPREPERQMLGRHCKKNCTALWHPFSRTAVLTRSACIIFSAQKGRI
jgi:import receptor subunit TOM22